MGSPRRVKRYREGVLIGCLRGAPRLVTHFFSPPPPPPRPPEVPRGLGRGACPPT
ncbi:unnamed protein product [Penicillium salamii]|uniref:Uncharacterized protein n=1 Tax=Penicillium salamii TaxID=1612424 RepID=A0A9W4IKC3_9EURO|nr:unnamed protein product [Penicillium salamii]